MNLEPFQKVKDLKHFIFRWELIPFLAIGATTFLFQVLFNWMMIDLLSIPSAISILITSFFALIFHFLANKNFTFRYTHRDKSVILRYASLALVNYLLQIGLYLFFWGVIQLGIFLSLFLAASATTVFGYGVMKLWVFRKGTK